MLFRNTLSTRNPHRSKDPETLVTFPYRSIADHETHFSITRAAEFLTRLFEVTFAHEATRHDLHSLYLPGVMT